MRIETFFTSLLLACGGIAQPTSDGGQDASNDGISTTDSSVQCAHFAAAPLCNTLPQSTQVTLGCTSSPPKPQGGTLVDGFYELVQVDWDATANPCPTKPLTHSGTLEICGDTLLWLDVDESGPSHVDTKIQVTGTTVQFDDFCTDTQTFAFGYTATANQLIIFNVNPNTGLRLVMTFARQ